MVSGRLQQRRPTHGGSACLASREQERARMNQAASTALVVATISVVALCDTIATRGMQVLRQGVGGLVAEEAGEDSACGP